MQGMGEIKTKGGLQRVPTLGWGIWDAEVPRTKPLVRYPIFLLTSIFVQLVSGRGRRETSEVESSSIKSIFVRFSMILHCWRAVDATGRDTWCVFSCVRCYFFSLLKRDCVTFLFRGLNATCVGANHDWRVYCLKMNGVIIIKTRLNIFSSSLQCSQPDIIYYIIYSTRAECVTSPCEYDSTRRWRWLNI